MYKARCLRDTVQDIPYQYFKAGEVYFISEDCPVKTHFEPLEELSKLEGEKVVAEGIIQPEVQGKPKAIRVKSSQGPGLAEARA
jgi:hypothetical protein